MEDNVGAAAPPRAMPCGRWRRGCQQNNGKLLHAGRFSPGYNSQHRALLRLNAARRQNATAASRRGDMAARISSGAPPLPASQSVATGALFRLGISGTASSLPSLTLSSLSLRLYQNAPGVAARGSDISQRTSPARREQVALAARMALSSTSASGVADIGHITPVANVARWRQAAYLAAAQTWRGGVVNSGGARRSRRRQHISPYKANVAKPLCVAAARRLRAAKCRCS